MFDGGLLMPDGQPLPKLLIRDSIEEALGLWASVVPINLVEVEDDGRPYTQSTKYGQIRFRHVFINGPDPAPPALPVAKAQAYYPSSGVIGGDVEYDHGDRWQEVGTTPQPDILGATVHELGHSLGLGHTDDESANMYWIFTRSSGLGTASLQDDDITGIQSIYGAGIGSVTPLAGSWQDRPIPAGSSQHGVFEFTSVPNNRWFSSPSLPELRFTALDGTLFSQIAELPSEFGPLAVTVDGTFLGEFSAGQNVSFAAFPGGGVSEFVISGLHSLGDPQFAVKLAFTTATGSFLAIGTVPEPATLTILTAALIALCKSRPRRTPQPLAA